jgi:hypothetical protein
MRVFRVLSLWSFWGLVRGWVGGVWVGLVVWGLGFWRAGFWWGFGWRERLGGWGLDGGLVRVAAGFERAIEDSRGRLWVERVSQILVLFGW